MNKLLLSAIVSTFSFAMFFMLSLTGSVDGQGTIHNVAVQFDVPAAIAEDDEDKDSNKDEHKGDDDDRDNDKDSNNDSHDNDGARADNENSAADASCVCPPGVRSCVCADGTPGSENTNATLVPNALRSIHGGS
ncbi:hypothetical protein JYT48_01135 [Mariprofundus ferrooxydans]|nr:hypothetical protein [Mariprofundus ferrooxydans]